MGWVVVEKTVVLRHEARLVPTISIRAQLPQATTAETSLPSPLLLEIPDLT